MKKSTWADVQASMRLSKLRPGTVKEDTLVEEFEQVVAYFDCFVQVEDVDEFVHGSAYPLVRVDEPERIERDGLWSGRGGWTQPRRRMGTSSLS